MTAHYSPMRLLRIPKPFDHEECLYEVKLDGFRALAHVTGDQCQLVSRNGHDFKSWPQLAAEIADVVQCKSVVLDGEICCLGPDGLHSSTICCSAASSPYFYAFDVLSIDGEDLTGLTLLKRKRRLRSIIPTIACRLLHLDWVVGRGTDLYRLACEQDLEGIVAKWRHGTYQCDRPAGAIRDSARPSPAKWGNRLA